MFDLFTAAVLMTVIFLLITIADVMTNKLITKGTKRKSVITCLLIAVAAMGECVGVYTNGASVSYILLHKIAKLVEFSCAPAIGVAAAIAYGGGIKPRLAIGLTAVHALFECVAMQFEWVFSIDAGNIYHRESLYVIYIAAFLVATAYGFISIIRNGKKYQVNVDSVLMLILLMLLVGIGIQFVYSEIKIDYVCISIGNMLFCIRSCKIILQVDAVTLLLNRRCYDVNIADLSSNAVVLFFDVDRFKQINDTYGHSVGDICLRNIARQLHSVYGKYGLCYRIGGDEFCVILHNGMDKVEELNGKFASSIKELQKEDSRMTGVSVGYAHYDAALTHIQNVIEEADAMLYRKKIQKREE